MRKYEPGSGYITLWLYVLVAAAIVITFDHFFPTGGKNPSHPTSTSSPDNPSTRLREAEGEELMCMELVRLPDGTPDYVVGEECANP